MATPGRVCAVHRPAAPCVLAREIRNYNQLPSQIRAGPTRCEVRVVPRVARGSQLGVQEYRTRTAWPLAGRASAGRRALPCVDAACGSRSSSPVQQPPPSSRVTAKIPTARTGHSSQRGTLVRGTRYTRLSSIFRTAFIMVACKWPFGPLINRKTAA